MEHWKHHCCCFFFQISNGTSIEIKNRRQTPCLRRCSLRLQTPWSKPPGGISFHSLRHKRQEAEKTLVQTLHQNHCFAKRNAAHFNKKKNKYNSVNFWLNRVNNNKCFIGLTVSACMATWGSLWFTLLIIDRRHSLGLQQKGDLTARWDSSKKNKVALFL